MLTKGANTTDLEKRLKDWHADLYKEFHEFGDGFHFNITEA